MEVAGPLGTPLASRVAQGVSGPSSSCVWNPRVFADDARGWQCPFVQGTQGWLQQQSHARGQKEQEEAAVRGSHLRSQDQGDRGSIEPTPPPSA